MWYYYQFQAMQTKIMVLLMLLVVAAKGACNSSQYPTMTSPQCLPCTLPCSECVGPSKGQCTACTTGYTLNPFSGVPFGACIASNCTNGFINSTNKCQNCNTKCKKCFGPTINQCAQCIAGYYQLDYKTCSQCYAGCLNCIDNAQTNCIKCKDSYYLDPLGSGSGSCLECHTSCYTCKGPTVNDCSECKDQNYLNITDTQCKPCHTSCKKCINETEDGCTDCKLPNTYLQYVDSTNLSGTCTYCSPNCATCSNSSNNGCKTCINQYFKNNVVDDLGSCDKCSSICAACQLGYPQNCDSCFQRTFRKAKGSEFTCINCTSHCRQCQNQQLNSCKQCQDGYFLKNINLGKGSCEPCSINCSKCKDEKPAGCQDCKSEFFFNANDPPDSFGTCDLCPKVCTTCLIPSLSNCTSCVQGMYVKKNQTSDSSGQCDNCSVGCKSCKSSQPSKCTQCINTYYRTNTGDPYGQCLQCESPCVNCQGPNDGSCKTCINGTYLNNKYCFSCQFNCITCVNSNQNGCYSCNSSIHILNKIPSKNYGSCDDCHINCLTCNQPPNSSNCNTCKPKFFQQTANPYKCTACHYTCETCINKEQTSCLTCNDSYSFRKLQNGKCKCMPFKMERKQQQQFVCVQLKCDDGSGLSIHPVNGVCEAICGDGLVADSEQCDDFNLDNLDGCNSLCQIQKGYKCYGSKSSKSTCKIQFDLEGTLLSIIKDPFSNTLTFKFKFNQTIQQMENINYSKITNLGFQNYQYTHYQYKDGVITLKLQYFQDIDPKDLNIFIDFSIDSYKLRFMSNVIINYDLISQNNLAIRVYQPQIYNLVTYVQTFVRVVLIMGFIVAASGMYRGKIISIELLGTLQLTYLGMVLLKEFDPLMYYMREMVYSNGYNINIQDSSSVTLPNNLNGMKIDLQLLQNVNVMFALPILIAFSCLVMFVITKLKISSELKDKVCKWMNPLIGQFLFLSMIFLLYQVSFSFAVMIRNFHSAGVITYASLVAFGIYLGGLVGCLIIYKIKDDNHMGQFSSFFKAKSVYQFYYISHVIQRTAIAVILGLFGTNYISAIISILIIAFHCGLIAIFKPYSLRVENYRSIAIMMCGAINLGLFLALNKIGSSNKENKYIIYSPFLILSILSISNIISAYFIAIQIKVLVKFNIQMSKDLSEPGVPFDQIEEDLFQRQMNKRIQSGSKQAINLSRMAKKKKKTKRMIKNLVYEQDGGMQDLQLDNQLKNRILNFDQFQNQWLERQNQLNQPLDAIEQQPSINNDQDNIEKTAEDQINGQQKKLN